MSAHTSKSRRQAEKEATRARILDAARELFEGLVSDFGTGAPI